MSITKAQALHANKMQAEVIGELRAENSQLREQIEKQDAIIKNWREMGLSLWAQFAAYNHPETKYSNMALSVLEDLEHCLESIGLIDAQGVPNWDGQVLDATPPLKQEGAGKPWECKKHKLIGGTSPSCPLCPPAAKADPSEYPFLSGGSHAKAEGPCGKKMEYGICSRLAGHLGAHTDTPHPPAPKEKP